MFFSDSENSDKRILKLIRSPFNFCCFFGSIGRSGKFFMLENDADNENGVMFLFI